MVELIKAMFSNIPGYLHILIAVMLLIIIVVACVLKSKIRNIVVGSCGLLIAAYVILGIVFLPDNTPDTIQGEVITLADGSTFVYEPSATSAPQAVGEISADVLNRIDKLYEEVNDLEFDEVREEVTDAEKLQAFIKKLTGTDITINESSALLEILEEAGALGN